MHLIKKARRGQERRRRHRPRLLCQPRRRLRLLHDADRKSVMGFHEEGQRTRIEQTVELSRF